MGCAVSSLAFPAPPLDREFYQTHGLLRRSDLIYLTTSNGERIPAIYKRKSAPFNDDAERLTIIYSHGNAEDIGLHLPFVDALSYITDCDVLSYEYVGYSLSRIDEGADPSESGCIRSIDAAWRYLVREQKVPPHKIILYGRSIGTGPTVDLASRSAVDGLVAAGGEEEDDVSPLRARGVVLQSPIESGARAVFGKGVSIVGYPLDIFRNYTKIHKIAAPVAIVHGTADEVVPCANGRALHSNCQQPYKPLWIKGRGHNDMPDRDVLEYVGNFVDALRVGGPKGPYSLDGDVVRSSGGIHPALRSG